MVDRVIAFYLDTSNGRVSPNMKDTVFINVDGIKTRVAKHFMMFSLNECYQAYKQKYPEDKISISKFSTLKPKQCIWGGLRGFKNTCTCIYHENYKFILTACHTDMKTMESFRGIFCDIASETCMLGYCYDCPKVNQIDKLMANIEEDSFVEFKTWTKGPNTELTTITEGVEDFKMRLYDEVPKIAVHHFIMKKQSDFLNTLKERLKTEDSIVITVDFAENYSFVIQDEVQSFHWNNQQATLVPFVIDWFSSDEDKLLFKCFMVISDELHHDASVFHIFKTKVLHLIKKEHPNITKIYYVSDGAGSQFKNFKNYANLMYHHKDFTGISAEFHHTATGHGKSRCDGFGGAVKNSVRRASLKKDTFILTPKQMYDYCNSNLSKATMEFLYISKEEVANGIQSFKLEERYSKARTISGTRKYHSFIPIDESRIVVRTFSSSSRFDTKMFMHSLGNLATSFTSLPCIGQCAVTKTVGIVQLGRIVDLDEDKKEVLLKFMRRTRGNNFYETIKDDWFSFDEIICITSPPSFNGKSYKFFDTDYEVLLSLLPMK